MGLSSSHLFCVEMKIEQKIQYDEYLYSNGPLFTNQIETLGEKSKLTIRLEIVLTNKNIGWIFFLPKKI